MANRSLLPSLWRDDEADGNSPIAALRKRMDDLFDDFDDGLPFLGDSFKVCSNVSETDYEICITAELPGMERKDIDISISGNRVTVQGEKKSEKEEKKEEDGREFRRIERSSGSFHRSMTVPFEIGTDKVTAEMKNGVLTVTIEKPAEIKKQTKKIEIKSSS